jgi:hypothetical protein
MLKESISVNNKHQTIKYYESSTNKKLSDSQEVVKFSNGLNFTGLRYSDNLKINSVSVPLVFN